jgi:uncharacterized protein (DUF58 family)
VEALYNLEAEPVEPDIGAATAYLEARHRRRSLVVLFTDLGEPEAAGDLVPRMRYLARRHLPLVNTLRDPDLEELSSLPPDTVDHVYQRAVARSVLRDRESILRSLQNAGVLTLDVPANRLSASVINRYLEIKARGRL